MPRSARSSALDSQLIDRYLGTRFITLPNRKWLPNSKKRSSPFPLCSFEQGWPRVAFGSNVHAEKACNQDNDDDDADDVENVHGVLRVRHARPRNEAAMLKWKRSALRYVPYFHSGHLISHRCRMVRFQRSMNCPSLPKKVSDLIQTPSVDENMLFARSWDLAGNSGS
jgi:hypothetical protein